MDTSGAQTGKSGEQDAPRGQPASGTASVVLVANRAEIACRIIKACHKLQLKAVAVYTEPGTLFVGSLARPDVRATSAHRSLVTEHPQLLPQKAGYSYNTCLDTVVCSILRCMHCICVGSKSPALHVLASPVALWQLYRTTILLCMPLHMHWES